MYRGRIATFHPQFTVDEWETTNVWIWGAPHPLIAMKCDEHEAQIAPQALFRNPWVGHLPHGSRSVGRRHRAEFRI